MSFGEIFVVLLVALLALRPEDYKHLISSINKLYKYLMQMKQEIISQINKIAEIQEEVIKETIEDQEQINFYLKKIFELDQPYSG
ncbi:MAG: hypothetical protein SFT91_05645, partial [Rickettsiaceae bacterium]|nr:hypothetical protein [Rickettsiaceae bacterium]